MIKPNPFQNLSESTHHLNEAVEQVARIVGAGRALGMVLNRKGLLRRNCHSFATLIIEVHVGELRLSRESSRIDRIPVVVGADLDRTLIEILHGLISAPMPELELVGLGSHSQGEDLVPHADTEHRYFS